MVSLEGTRPDNPQPEVNAESQPLDESVLNGPDESVPAGGIAPGDVRPSVGIPPNQGLFDPGFSDEPPLGQVESDIIDLDGFST